MYSIGKAGGASVQSIVGSFSSTVTLELLEVGLEGGRELDLALLHVFGGDFVIVDMVDLTSCNLADALVMVLCLVVHAEAGFG